MQNHWEQIYRTKLSSDLSWFRPHLEASIELIGEVAPELSSAIIDVGAGNSTLIDDLLARGYRNVTALDISEVAFEETKKRLGAVSQEVRWLVSDVLQAPVASEAFDVWHDRATFHFLERSEERQAYVQQAAASLRKRGHLVLGVFSTEGPSQCSGLDVRRYDAAMLAGEFATHFRLQRSTLQLHQTPGGVTQPFLYCVFELI